MNDASDPSLLIPILKLLASGKPQKTKQIAAALSSSQQSISALLPQLKALGVQQKNTILSLPEPLSLLSEADIRQGLSQLAGRTFKAIHLLDSVDSTNNEAKRYCAINPSATGVVWLAEQQTAGRGRLGRSWHSPFGANIYLTALLSMPAMIVAQGFSLAVGVAVAEALLDHEVLDVKLKWPNDILHQSHKLGGILIEVPEAGCVVVGIGLNVRMPPTTEQIDQAWTDLSHLLPVLPARSHLVAGLLNCLAETAIEFSANGLAKLGPKWQALDAFYGQRVCVKSDVAETIYGTAEGISQQGALQIRSEGKLHSFASGEVSIRLL